MNNFHLFLIRSDCVTQLAAHLLAGILALVLFVSLDAPKESPLPAPAPAQPTHVTEHPLPAGAIVVAAAGEAMRH
jgi:hypothetical protein